MLTDLLDKPVDALHFGGNTGQAAETRARAQLFPQDAILLVDLKKAHNPTKLVAGVRVCGRASVR